MDEVERRVSDELVRVPPEHLRRGVIDVCDNRDFVLALHRNPRRDLDQVLGRLLGEIAVRNEHPNQHAVTLAHVEEIEHCVCTTAKTDTDMGGTHLAYPIPCADHADAMRRVDDIECGAAADHHMTTQIDRRRKRHEQAVRVDGTHARARMRRQQGAKSRLDRFRIDRHDIAHILTVGIHNGLLEHL